MSIPTVAAMVKFPRWQADDTDAMRREHCLHERRNSPQGRSPITSAAFPEGMADGLSGLNPNALASYKALPCNGVQQGGTTMMKTTLLRNMLVVAVALFTALFALPQRAQAEDFGLRIAGVQVTSVNCGDLSVIPGVTGFVKYDPRSRTLTLDNATIAATDDNSGIDANIDGLTVRVDGTSDVTAENDDAIKFAKPAVILGGGTLNTKTGSTHGILVHETKLIIEDCIVDGKKAVKK